MTHLAAQEPYSTSHEQQYILTQGDLTRETSEQFESIWILFLRHEPAFQELFQC